MGRTLVVALSKSTTVRKVYVFPLWLSRLANDDCQSSALCRQMALQELSAKMGQGKNQRAISRSAEMTRNFQGRTPERRAENEKNLSGCLGIIIAVFIMLTLWAVVGRWAGWW